MKIPLPLIVAFSLAALTLNGAAKDHIYRTTSFVQPNGTELELRVKGSMFYATTETVDGYTVIYSAAENKYYYAQPCPSGGSIVPSELVVGVDSPVALQKHLCMDKASRNEIVTKRKEKFDKHRAERWSKRVKAAKLREKVKKGGNKVPNANFASGIDPVTGEENGVAAAAAANFADVLGSKVGLTIVVQFPDVASPVSQAKIDRYCNEIGYNDNGNSGSVRDYFSDQSVGLLDYTMKVSTVATLPNPRNFYNYSDYPTNNTLRNTGEAGNMVIRDAVQVLKDENFNFDGLTLDNNKVLSTNVLFAGADSGVWAQGLWPHQWQMQEAYAINVTVDGQARAISAYQITNVEDAAPTIGTFIHESGHLLLDYPDLYDYDGDSSGLGIHALMCAGNYSDGGKTPAPINLHFKDLVGWANITEITVNDFASVTLPSTGNVGYQITNPANPDECFVFENRGDGDIWAKGVPDKGVMIWHVDSGVTGNNNQQMTAGSHYQVSLEQADGLFQLETSSSGNGDSSDAFDSNNEPFNDLSLPDSKWWSGQSSGMMVEVISLPGSNMDIVFGGFGVIYPNGGEVVTNLGPSELRWAAGGTSDVSIELYKGGGYHSTIIAATANDGSYIWNLDGTLADGVDYTILVTSLADPTLFDASDAAFSIAPETTGGGGKIPNDWKVPGGADKGWIVSDEFVTEGLYSFKSSNISHSQKCAIQYTGSMVAGNISFDCKVSSEPQFDFFNLYIDGVKQTIDPNDGVVLGYGYLGYLHKGRSGDRDWANFSFPVSAGVHTIRLEYKKDHTSSWEYYFRDSVWVDNIQLPVVSPAPAFATWTEDHFGVNQNIMEIAGSEVDTDNDGIKNFAEYVFGLDPLQADQVKVDIQRDGNQLSLIYPKNTAATDATYRVMESVSLTTGWTEAVVEKQEILSTNGNVEIIKATVIVPDGHQSHFLKLHVE